MASEHDDRAVAADFDLSGVLRRIRRTADLSQRELAAAAALSPAAVAHAEAGTRNLPVGGRVRAAGVAGLRLPLLDDQGQEVGGMSAAGVRDRGDRRFRRNWTCGTATRGGGPSSTATPSCGRT